MTILTSALHFIGQLDKCYVIIDGVWIVPVVDTAGCWCDCQWFTFYYINSISTQYDFVTASTETIIY
jgi:hypothetical protein